MPQFKPFWWIQLISWMFTILIILVSINQTILLPATINSLVSRIEILFQLLK